MDGSNDLMAVLGHVELNLKQQIDKGKPSLPVIRDNVLPQLRYLMEYPNAMAYVNDHGREALISVLRLLEIALHNCSQTKTQVDPTSEVLDTFRNERKQIIESTIIVDKSQLPHMNDIVGQKEAKKALMEAVMDPILYPEWFSTLKFNPWRCILLYGPPGTGKTCLSQSIARRLETRFYQVSASDLISTWSGQSEKMIRDLFDHALAHNGPSVIFIDEIDSLCRARHIAEDDNNRRVKTELLLQLQRLHSSSNSVLFICATNCPWELDAAFIRRFEKRIFVGLPDAASRGILLKKFLSNLTVSDDINWNVLEIVTDGYTGDDLRRLAREVAFLQFDKFKKSCNEDRSIDKASLATTVPVTADDFEQILLNFSPSVDNIMLSRYIEYSRHV